MELDIQYYLQQKNKISFITRSNTIQEYYICYFYISIYKSGITYAISHFLKNITIFFIANIFCFLGLGLESTPGDLNI